MKRDLEQLNLLSIFYYVYAGLLGFGACFGLIYVVLGILVLNGTFPTAPPRPGAPATGIEPVMGVMFLVIGGAIVVLGWTLAICVAIAGRSLARRKRWLFCCIVAGFCCMNVPLGTALGVCTFLVLFRPRVKDLFSGLIDEPLDPEDEDDDYDDDYDSRRRRRARRNSRDDDEEERDRADDVLPVPKADDRPRPDEHGIIEK